MDRLKELCSKLRDENNLTKEEREELVNQVNGLYQDCYELGHDGYIYREALRSVEYNCLETSMNSLAVTCLQIVRPALKHFKDKVTK